MYIDETMHKILVSFFFVVWHNQRAMHLAVDGLSIFLSFFSMGCL
jgi:hypothetical protein